MITGILAGVVWALETVVLGVALGMSPFVSDARVVFLSPFIATFLHDAFSAFFMLIYNIVRGKGKELLAVFKSKSFKWLVLASCIGGPIGMTGYVMAVHYMGASVGAVASAIYPAIGTALACLFLKEKVKWYRWIFLAMTLLGVYGLSYSPSLHVENFWLGLLGALMCAFGWGVEAVILARCLKDTSVKAAYALNIRQTVSALLYGTVILPLLGGWNVTASLLTQKTGWLFPTIAIAALCASISYLLYYRAIERLGAAKAMALNITYTAWAMLFTLLLLHDRTVLHPQTVGCAVVIVGCGLFAATDVKQLFRKKTKQNKQYHSEER